MANFFNTDHGLFQVDATNGDVAGIVVVSGKAATFNNSITFAGTDSTTMTFPSTSATIARTDAANTFTGHQTIEGVTTTGATGTGNLVFSASPTFTGTLTCATFSASGHLTVEGVTSTGATGTGNIVFSASPMFTGTLTCATFSASGHLTVEGVTSTGATGTGNIVFSASPTLSGTAALASATLSGTITNYHAVATVGEGIGAIIGQGNLTAQTANVAATDLVPAATINANMLIQVSVEWILTVVAGTSSTLPNLIVTWTDGDNSTAQSQTVNVSNTLYAGSGGTATNNTLTTRGHAVITAYCKSGVALQYATTGYISSPAAAMNYAIRARAIRIG